MSDDQQFLIACLTLVLPTVVSILTYRKTAETHEAVNGMQLKAVRKARRQGVIQGERAKAGKPRGTMGEAGYPREPQV